DPGAPRIGDMRVGFKIMPDGQATLVGRQGDGDVYPFQTQAGNRLLLGSAGIVPAADLFRSAQEANTIMTWVLRGVFLLLMACGWRTVPSPIGDRRPRPGGRHDGHVRSRAAQRPADTAAGATRNR